MTVIHLIRRCVLLIILAVTSSSVRAMEDPIASQTATIPPFNPHECRVAFDTTDQWTFVCGRHPDLYPILRFAEQVAREECEQAFSNQKWKCDGFSLLRAPNITKEANKEAAYVNTLRFAVIAHTVAKACRELGNEGLLHSCTCDGPTVQTGGDTISCSDDVDFGLQFADKFLRLGIGSTNSREFLDLHNFRVGELVIRKLMDSAEMTCICSGVSGSCTVQTCWNQLPDFSVVGNRIKELYDNAACLVQSNGKTGLQFAWISECGRATTEMDLLYNRQSPTYCGKDSYLGVVGVSGRECDPNSDGPNSCANLCGACGRGTVENHEAIEHQCDCTFHFCCEIRCDTCNTDRIYYTCS